MDKQIILHQYGHAVYCDKDQYHNTQMVPDSMFLKMAVTKEHTFKRYFLLHISN